MSALEYSRTVVVVLAVMAAIAVVEAMVPLFVRPTLPGRQRANLAMTIQTLAFAFVLTSSASVAAAYLPLASPGFMAAAGLPAFAQLLVGIVALDFAFGYNPFRSVPVVVVVGRSGRIVTVQIGVREGDEVELEQALDEAIDQRPERSLFTFFPPP